MCAGLVLYTSAAHAGSPPCDFKAAEAAYQRAKGLFLAHVYESDQDPKLAELSKKSGAAFGERVDCLRKIQKWDATSKEKQEAIALPLPD
jgi:hypothetical protein